MNHDPQASASLISIQITEGVFFRLREFADRTHAPSVNAAALTLLDEALAAKGLAPSKRYKRSADVPPER